MNWENTPSTATPLTADNLNHMDEGIERATDGAIALESEIATARGNSADLNTRFTADEASLEAVKSEITTARGSHNSLGARLDTADANLTKKADKTSTLAGYGITDAYTREKTNEKLARKLDSMPFDSEPTNNSPCYLTSGTVYSALLVKADKTALATKYDSSNIELGTATLTPYSTQIDKIKSATCLYEKIGDIVIVNVTVIMNATSLGGTSSISLLNMPFSNKSDVIVHDIGISKNGGMFRGSASKSAWLQFTPLNKQAYNFVADEQVNFSLIYKI
nr:MAG TPA: hypothetical protein [Caudoviricetes sp.]